MRKKTKRKCVILYLGCNKVKDNSLKLCNSLAPLFIFKMTPDLQPSQKVLTLERLELDNIYPTHDWTNTT